MNTGLLGLPHTRSGELRQPGPVHFRRGAASYTLAGTAGQDYVLTDLTMALAVDRRASLVIELNVKADSGSPGYWIRARRQDRIIPFKDISGNVFNVAWTGADAGSTYFAGMGTVEVPPGSYVLEALVRVQVTATLTIYGRYLVARVLPL